MKARLNKLAAALKCTPGRLRFARMVARPVGNLYQLEVFSTKPSANPLKVPTADEMVRELGESIDRCLGSSKTARRVLCERLAGGMLKLEDESGVAPMTALAMLGADDRVQREVGVQLLEALAAAGDTIARINLVKRLLNPGVPAKERNRGIDVLNELMWDKAIYEEHRAQLDYLYGLAYLSGAWGSLLKVNALAFFERAVNLGHADAAFCLACIFDGREAGFPFPEHKPTAARWYRKGYELGDEKSATNLAILHLVGLLPECDEQLALEALRFAASRDDIKAVQLLNTYARGGLRAIREGRVLFAPDKTKHAGAAKRRGRR